MPPPHSICSLTFTTLLYCPQLSWIRFRAPRGHNRQRAVVCSHEEHHVPNKLYWLHVTSPIITNPSFQMAIQSDFTITGVRARMILDLASKCPITPLVCVHTCGRKENKRGYNVCPCKKLNVHMGTTQCPWLECHTQAFTILLSSPPFV